MNSEEIYETEIPEERVFGTAAKVFIIIGFALGALMVLTSLIFLIIQVSVIIKIDTAEFAVIYVNSGAADLYNAMISYPAVFACIFAFGLLGSGIGSFAMATILSGMKPGILLTVLVLLFSSLVGGILLFMTTEADFKKQK